MNDSNIQNLASALAKSGVACSTAQAMAMARNIMGTEKRVSRHFDKQNKQIEKSLDKRSYQEEIDDLIKKTSPENKDYHIMVSGYSRDKIIMEKPAENKLNINIVEASDSSQENREMNKPASSFSTDYSPLERRETSGMGQTNISNINSEGRQAALNAVKGNAPVVNTQEIIENSSAQIDLENNSLANSQNNSLNSNAQANTMNNVEPVAETKSVAAEKPEIRSYEDLLDDERTLKEIMDEQAKEIYSQESGKETVLEKSAPIKHSEAFSDNHLRGNSSNAGSIPVIKEASAQSAHEIHQENKPLSNEIPEKKQDEIKEDGFIFSNIHEKDKLKESGPIDKDDDIGSNPSLDVKKPEKKRVFANPIEKIDLLDHFKF